MTPKQHPIHPGQYHHRTTILLVVFWLMTIHGRSFAENWPTLEHYVSKCEIIVKCRQVGDAELQKVNRTYSLEVVSVLKGKLDFKKFAFVDRDGLFHLRANFCGVEELSHGQDVVLFFVDGSKDERKYEYQSSAFVVVDNNLVYASTSDDDANPPTKMSLETFEEKIVEFVSRPPAGKVRETERRTD